MTASGTRTAGVAVTGTFAAREVINDVATVVARVEQALPLLAGHRQGEQVTEFRR